MLFPFSLERHTFMRNQSQNGYSIPPVLFRREPKNVYILQVFTTKITHLGFSIGLQFWISCTH